MAPSEKLPITFSQERRLKFRLGCTSASGTARLVEPLNRPHLFRVTLHRGRFTRGFTKFVSRRLPSPVQRVAHDIWPAWFLPDVVLVKKLKPNWEAEFENEKAVHGMLKPLQGRVVPVFHGEARCEDTRALVFSDVKGRNTLHQGPARISCGEYAHRLRVACAEMTEYNVVIGDLKLHNVMVLDKGIMLFDMEQYLNPKPDDLELFYGWNIDQMARTYENYLEGAARWGEGY